MNLEDRAARFKIRWQEGAGRKLSDLPENLQDAAFGGLARIARPFERWSRERRFQSYLEEQTDCVLERLADYESMDDNELQEQSDSLRTEVRAAFEAIEAQENWSEEKKMSEKEKELMTFIPEAYSLVHEAIVRAELPSNKGGKITALTRQQIKGGIALLDNIIDMKTGEGKTLTALLPAYLRSLTGEGVHINTVNEYLAFRDYQQAEKVFSRLGVSLGVTLSTEEVAKNHQYRFPYLVEQLQEEVTEDMNKHKIPEKVVDFVKKEVMPQAIKEVEGFIASKHADKSEEEKTDLWENMVNDIFHNQVNGRLVYQRDEIVSSMLPCRIQSLNKEWKKESFAADITYGYQGEFAFDYLRDNTQLTVEAKVNPEKRFGFAIIDEIDNILIDSGRMPHVLSERIPKVYSDKKMRHVRDTVLELMSEQRAKIAEAEQELTALDDRVTKRHEEVIAEYAKEENLDADELTEELNNLAKKAEGNGNLDEKLTDLKVRLSRADKEFSDELGVRLFQLKHMTSSSNIFDQLFKKHQTHYFKYANKEKEDREELFADLDYLIEERAIMLTEKGIKKLYKTGLMKSTTVRINEKGVRDYLEEQDEVLKVGEEPRERDYLDFLKHLTSTMAFNDWDAYREVVDKCKQGEDIDIEVTVDSVDNQGVWKLINTFMRSVEFFREGENYLVHEGKVIVIDKETGRHKPGSRFSGGIHEALECLQDLDIKEPGMTKGSISLQKYFMLYQQMTGMSGSVLPAATELEETYKTATVAIEPSVRLKREDHEGLKLYTTKDAKLKAIVQEIDELRKQGRPVLLGVKTVNEAKYYENILEQQLGLHEEDLLVLSAADAQEDGFDEADLVGKAGSAGRVTIATNMAGRGTDIKLSKEAAKNGGLHVLLTYLPDSLRSIHQFIGRAGRLGDPGSSTVYGSIEDEVFSYMQGSTALKVIDLFGGLVSEEGDLCEQVPFAGMMINKTKNKILGMKEDVARKQREHTLKYDDASSALRNRFYALRDELLEEREPLTLLCDALEEQVQSMRAELPRGVMATEDSRICKYLDAKEEIETWKKERPPYFLDTKNKLFTDLALLHIDAQWAVINGDLTEILDSIHLRSYGQRNPVTEYAHVCVEMYDSLYTGMLDMLVDKVLEN